MSEIKVPLIHRSHSTKEKTINKGLRKLYAKKYILLLKII
jgi:hypothetical protein